MLSVQFKQGKVGPDGKELIPHESPTVNGYGFENMPSPAPGKWVSVTVWRQIKLNLWCIWLVQEPSSYLQTCHLSAKFAVLKS